MVCGYGRIIFDKQTEQTIYNIESFRLMQVQIGKCNKTKTK